MNGPALPATIAATLSLAARSAAPDATPLAKCAFDPRIVGRTGSPAAIADEISHWATT